MASNVRRSVHIQFSTQKHHYYILLDNSPSLYSIWISGMHYLPHKFPKTNTGCNPTQYCTKNLMVSWPQMWEEIPIFNLPPKNINIMYSWITHHVYIQSRAQECEISHTNSHKQAHDATQHSIAPKFDGSMDSNLRRSAHIQISSQKYHY